MAKAQAAKVASTENPLQGAVLIDLNSSSPSLKLLRCGHGDVPEYEVPEGTEHLVHVEVDQVNFSRTGSKRSVPIVVKTPPEMWSFMRKHMLGQGYSYMRILHAPKNADVGLEMTETAYEAYTAPKEDGEPLYVFPTKPTIVSDGKPKRQTRLQAMKEKKQ